MPETCFAQVHNFKKLNSEVYFFYKTGAWRAGLAFCSEDIVEDPTLTRSEAIP